MTDMLTMKVVFVTEICPNCGVVFALTDDYRQRRQDDHRNFYCPNGHGQHYPQESDLERLQKELKQKERALKDAGMRLEMEREQRHAAERELQTVKQRVVNGICPCCHRSFAQLQRHMRTKHPDYAHKAQKQP